MKEHKDPISVALYARVSSDRQDVDLSVAAQLRALRDYANKNGYFVAREYVDEAESGREARGEVRCRFLPDDPLDDEEAVAAESLDLHGARFVEEKHVGCGISRRGRMRGARASRSGSGPDSRAGRRCRAHPEPRARRTSGPFRRSPQLSGGPARAASARPSPRH